MPKHLGHLPSPRDGPLPLRPVAGLLNSPVLTEPVREGALVHERLASDPNLCFTLAGSTCLLCMQSTGQSKNTRVRANSPVGEEVSPKYVVWLTHTFQKSEDLRRDP